ncbi:hypothetical protein [Salinibius halmophilus]|uniref:hypothetical protein n=1 Tax=Salinibius halmophilus TaxID=1853216 RepID=UPI000E6711AD|nr:hypothetical protein [Salinibius halmophilus]
MFDRPDFEDQGVAQGAVAIGDIVPVAGGVKVYGSVHGNMFSEAVQGPCERATTALLAKKLGAPLELINFAAREVKDQTEIAIKLQLGYQAIIATGKHNCRYRATATAMARAVNALIGPVNHGWR